MKSKRLAVPFVLVVTVTAAVVSSIGIHLQNSITTETRDGPGRPSRARVVLNQFADDDGERRRLFSQDLGDRCVLASVVKMDGPTAWIVDCESGQRLRLVYDRRGNLTHVIDQRRLTLWSLPEDEPERQSLFNRVLGHHCQVVSSRMESPGTWIAECGSGARFRLVSRDGFIVESSEVPVAALEARRP